MTPDLASLVQVNLRWGRDRARSIGDIAESMGVARRQVERSIEELRARGRSVCSGSDGVWLTTDAAELRAQYRALRRRAIRQLVNARVLLATARRFERAQQLTLTLE